VATELSTKEAPSRAAEGGVLADEQLARDFADRWQKAWNARMPGRVTELCTEDVVWDDPITERPERGRAAVESYLVSVWRAFPDLEFTWPEGPYSSFERVKLALHWHVEGTMLGPLDPPGFAPTGRRFAIDGIDLLELRDGLVCAYAGFFDVRGVAQQVGALPAPGSRAERVAVALQRLAARRKGSRR
jgi:steroid delta-isomerase-like uncharacterized protein